MQEHHIPGVSIAVVHDYQLQWAQGFGMADIKNNIPVTPDTLFQAASISKPVTAMAALKAVEEGKLSLDQNINEVLISWKVPGQTTVTLRKLLSHSAGFNVSGFGGYAQGEKIPTLLEVLEGLPPANSPAIRVTNPQHLAEKKFDYSGGGYTVVQQALIDLYKPFPETMAQLVLDPLRMTNSTFEQPLPAQFNNFAIPYRPNGRPVQGGPHIYVEEAAAGLWSTPSDLAKYVISIQKSLQGEKNQLLSQKYAKLLAVKTESSAPSTQMGLGMEVSLNKEGKPQEHGHYFSHLGQNAGYRNLLIANATNGDSIIIMTNMSPARNEPAGKGWDFIFAIEKKLVQANGWK
jgi:CubicO group peptidase (beta-lactamase class C family)